MIYTEKKFDKLYIKKTLKKKLSQMLDKSVSIISAPTGYGKSVILQAFFTQHQIPFWWIKADDSEEIFWYRLCFEIRKSNPDFADRIEEIGVPKNGRDIIRIVEVIQQQKDLENQFMILDDTQYLLNPNFRKLFEWIVQMKELKFHFVFITRKLTNPFLMNKMFKDYIFYISKDDFALGSKDIAEVFKLNGMNSSKEIASRLYENTNGWPIMVKLQLQDNHAEIQDMISDKMAAFIYYNIWNLLSQELRNFMLSLCILEDYGIVQVAEATGKEIDSVYQILADSQMIEYNYITSRFHMNPVFRRYLLNGLNSLPEKQRADLILTSGKNYASEQRYVAAMKCFREIKRFDLIYAMRPEMEKMYHYVVKKNKPDFIEVAHNYHKAGPDSGYEFALMLLFVLFLYNEKQMMISMSKKLYSDITQDETLTVDVRYYYLAEIQYISAFLFFNDYQFMCRYFSEIKRTVDKPLDIVAGKFPFTFGSPSMMYLYHIREGELDVELRAIENGSASYYSITNSHGYGYEALMKAEILFNRGDFNGAEILSHKAVHMADSNNQKTIYICAIVILARLTIVSGNIDEFNRYLELIYQSVAGNGEKETQFSNMMDLCYGFIFSTTDDQERIPAWLKSSKKLEANSNYITLNYACMIHCKYLILNQKYHHILGIGGQYIGLTKVYSYILPGIYIRIYIAVAYFKLNNMDKARDFLVEAIRLALPDMIYMPFVENYDYIEELIEELSIRLELFAFIRQIRKLHRTYARGYHSLKRAGNYEKNFGLTQREAEIAKYAAQRYSNKEIAEMLFIAESTVKSALKIIFNKLGIKFRHELRNYFE